MNIKEKNTTNILFQLFLSILLFGRVNIWAETPHLQQCTFQHDKTHDIIDGTAEPCDNEDQQKLIVVLSNPRSLSTVFLRMMEARGDCFISCEPGRKFKEKAQEVVESQCREHSFICIKEMAVNAHIYLLGGELEKLFLKQAYHIFLIRNPHHSLISYYQAVANDNRFEQSLELLWYFLDLSNLYGIYERVVKNASYKPIVIMVDDLVCSPEMTVQTMCQSVDIPFNTSCLQWDPLPISSNNYDDEIVSEIWYKDALQSTGFGKPTSYACDSNGEPTFEEIDNPAHKELYMQLYRKNLPFYKKFARAAQTCHVVD